MTWNISKDDIGRISLPTVSKRWIELIECFDIVLESIGLYCFLESSRDGYTRFLNSCKALLSNGVFSCRRTLAKSSPSAFHYAALMTIWELCRVHMSVRQGREMRNRTCMMSIKKQEHTVLDELVKDVHSRIGHSPPQRLTFLSLFFAHDPSKLPVHLHCGKRAKQRSRRERKKSVEK